MLPLLLSRMLNSLVGQNPMPLLMHVIQCKVSVRPGYVINQVRPDLLRQNVIRMTQPSFNPDPTVLFEYISLCRIIPTVMLSIILLLIR